MNRNPGDVLGLGSDRKEERGTPNEKTNGHHQ